MAGEQRRALPQRDRATPAQIANTKSIRITERGRAKICGFIAVLIFAASLQLAGMAGADAQWTSKLPLVVDDAVTGKAMLGRFDYIGRWQHVSGKHDGRTDGTSTRSTHTGDVAILGFTGTRVRLYGIAGPSGGRAGIALDDESTGGRPVDFYAPHLRTHALIYQSPVMTNGIHTISIVVWGTRDPHGRYYYVNLDGAEIDR